MSAEDQPLQINIDEACMVFDGYIPEGTDGADADEIDSDIHSVKMRDSVLQHGLNVFRLADVGCNDGNLAALLGRFERNVVQKVGPTCGQNQIDTSGRQF